MSSTTQEPHLNLEEFQCFEIRNPPETEIQSVRLAVNENPQNVIGSARVLSDYMDSTVTEDGLSYLAVNIKKLWQPGRTLKIKFLSGEQRLHERVQKYAQMWLVNANLKFAWVPTDAPKADIRIDFQQGAGSSSRIGADALLERNQSKRTMNLDINTRHSEDFIRRKVLHEFGHVLGCEHEHQSPLATFEWNKETIYEELSQPPNSWSRATIDHNVIKRLESKEINASSYDADSIMLYEYPARWFKNSGGVGTKNNTRLSSGDKEWIASNYPPWSSDIGHFSTLNVRPLDSISYDIDQKDIAFEPAYAEAPRVAVGLSWLDLDHTADICVKTTAEDVSYDHFTVGIAPGSGCKVNSAACSWLEASASEPDIKMGQWNLGSAWASGNKPAGNRTSTLVKFDNRFDGSEDPIVVSWLTGFSLGHDSPWRVKTYVTDISPFKFVLHLETGHDTDIRDATVTWVAIPRGKEGMIAGSFYLDGATGAQHAGKSMIDFQQANFQVAPSVMMAISGFDFEHGHNLRLRVSNSSLTKDGMVGHLDSWLDSTMNMAAGAYVAIGGPSVDLED